MVQDGVFEDTFSSAWFSKENTESTLLRVHLKDLKVALLMHEKGGVFINHEGVSRESEVTTYHKYRRLKVRLVTVKEGLKVGLAVVALGNK